MDTLFSLKVFCQVVEQGSFTRAADKLGISTAMASKHVSHLENHIRARLLHRNSRSLHLSEEGEQYYRQCRDALETLDNAAARASLGQDKAHGHLRLTAPIWCANPVFAQWIHEYRAQHPDVSLDIVLDNRMRDLAADGFDLALRVSAAPSPSLIVRPLFAIHFALVATPTYIRRHGLPHTPEQAEKHHAVLPSYTDVSRMPFGNPEDNTALHLHSALSSNNTLMLHQLILAHCGIGYLPCWLIENDLASGRLIRLLPNLPFRSLTLHAAYLDRRHLRAKIRTFIDFMVEKGAALANYT